MTGYLDLPLGDLLDRVAAPEPGPGGGLAAAVATSLAASLVVMVARRSRDSWPEAGGAAAQAIALRDRAMPLADSDAEAWAEALEALRGGTGDDELEERLARAADVPLAIARTAADVAELAALAAELGDGTYRGDAAAAAALADGAARSAGRLVELNLGVNEGDWRLADARASERRASEAAARALDSGP